MKILKQCWFVGALLLSVLIAVTACGPSKPWRLWQAGTDSQWEEKDLYPTRAECEAGRRGLKPIQPPGTRIACVPEGQRPEEIGRE